MYILYHIMYTEKHSQSRNLEDSAIHRIGPALFIQ